MTSVAVSCSSIASDWEEYTFAFPYGHVHFDRFGLHWSSHCAVLARLARLANRMGPVYYGILHTNAVVQGIEPPLSILEF